MLDTRSLMQTRLARRSRPAIVPPMRLPKTLVLLAALLELMQTEFRAADLEFARALADRLLDQFEDNERGGFYFTSHDHEKLILRNKPGHDNATPSGNGVAAMALQRLALLTGNSRYTGAAERVLALYQPQLSERPSGFASTLMALEEYLQPTRTVILRGPEGQLPDWQRALARQYLPETMVIAVPGGATGLPAVIDKPAGADVNAWVCEGVTCLAPLASIDAVSRTLQSRTTWRSG